MRSSMRTRVVGRAIYKGGGHGRFGTIERGHVLEKFGKHLSKAKFINFVMADFIVKTRTMTPKHHLLHSCEILICWYSLYAGEVTYTKCPSVTSPFSFFTLRGETGWGTWFLYSLNGSFFSPWRRLATSLQQQLLKEDSKFHKVVEWIQDADHLSAPSVAHKGLSHSEWNASTQSR